MTRDPKKVASPVSAGNSVRTFLLLVPLIAGGCASCSSDELYDISCKPGDPAEGQFDSDRKELCDNLIDDNCDGNVNEGCDCLDGEEYTCGTDVGACETATVVCEGGQWPECIPTQPTLEICDGVDNDCDGEVDEGLVPVECWTGPEDSVLDGTTPCHKGISFCEEGGWTECRDQQLPDREICDAIDNDCNGEIDDDPVTDGDSCGPAVQIGQCIQGVQYCSDTGESICIGAVYGQNEGCDGVDNDCDGQTDEELYKLCETACGQGVEYCSAGAWVGCTALEPTLEICDGIDNDCDGELDEGCLCVDGDAQVCYSNIVDSGGNPIDCGFGVQICDTAGQWGPCTFFGTEPESCNNHDDDCDGTVDGMTQICGDPTTAGIGVCVLGTETCEAGVWLECVGAVLPQDEICDQLDNDCDGLIDEDIDPHDKVDMMFLIDISGSMCTYSSALASGIATYASDFAGTEHQFGIVVFPGRTGGAVASREQDLTDVATFQTAISSVGCSGGGFEPGYDALLMVSDSANPLVISWRADAYPYIVYITDEPAQTSNSVTESDVASQTVNCSLPGCSSGDSIEIFIITRSNYFLSYDAIVYQELDRLIDISPVSADRYTDIMRDIFANVCIPASLP